MDNLAPEEIADEEMINQAFRGLLNDYLNTKHRKKVEIITKAFNSVNQARKDIKRRSGEPYIMHPIAIANTVCDEIGLGSTSICAALLHDVVEDTDYTVEDIEDIFGPKIAQTVDGLTKISGGIFGDRASAQIENSRKLLLTVSNGIRVILIRIADRLHNVCTLGSILPNKQYRATDETLYIYTPLASHLGLYRIKTELGSLGFKYEHSEEYTEAEEKLNATAAERDKVLNNFTAPIHTRLNRMGLKYRILVRVKSIYSVWNRTQTKHVPFEEIYDLLAVQAILELHNEGKKPNDCFDIYVSISKVYKPHPSRLRDRASHPKASGYQTLHVILMDNNGQWIEVQICSERVSNVAEQGLAAHWKYKEEEGSEDEGELEKWLRTIKGILDDPQPSAIDFLGTIRLDLSASEIFVFAPKGELKTIPQNSTALDFTFSLHADTGSHYIDAKVNHKLVPLGHKLQSGDQVRTLTLKSQRVQPQWEVFAAIVCTRAGITATLRREREANQKIGEGVLNELPKKEEAHPEEAVIEKLHKLHNTENEEELLTAIGSKAIVLGGTDKNELKEEQTSSRKRYLIFSFGNSKEKQEEKEPRREEKISPKEVPRLTEESLQKKHTMVECCHPIPGDDILGYVDKNDWIIIHERRCPVAAKSKGSYGNYILTTKWNTRKELSFLVYIYIKDIDSVGLLDEVTQITSGQLNVNIRKLTIETEDGTFEGRIQLWVHNMDDIKTICNNLKKVRNAKQVDRVGEQPSNGKQENNER